MFLSKNHYETLGIPSFSGPEEIKKAYRRLAHKYHPDKNKAGQHGEEVFRQIKEAYDFLSNPLKKKDYDLVLRNSATPVSPYSFTRYTYQPADNENNAEPFDKQAPPQPSPSSIWNWLKPIIIIILSIIAMYFIMR